MHYFGETCIKQEFFCIKLINSNCSLSVFYFITVKLCTLSIKIRNGREGETAYLCDVGKQIP